MWKMWFKKRKNDYKKHIECRHPFVYIGRFYTIKYSEYTNRFDEIFIYKKSVCVNCGKEFDEFECKEEFPPQKLNSDRYIINRVKELEEIGVISEVKKKVEGEKIFMDYQQNRMMTTLEGKMRKE